jgi:HPt (histidine-containing phosphotransfer) domain-containing protein
MKYNIDLQEIADKFNLEIEDIEMILEVFLESANENLENIKNASEKSDMKSLSHFAHSIKGSALNLDLKEIAQLANEIELKSKNNEEYDYKSKYEKLKKLIDNLTN